MAKVKKSATNNPESAAVLVFQDATCTSWGVKHLTANEGYSARLTMSLRAVFNSELHAQMTPKGEDLIYKKDGSLRIGASGCSLTTLITGGTLNWFPVAELRKKDSPAFLTLTDADLSGFVVSEDSGKATITFTAVMAKGMAKVGKQSESASCLYGTLEVLPGQLTMAGMGGDSEELNENLGVDGESLGLFEDDPESEESHFGESDEGDDPEDAPEKPAKKRAAKKAAKKAPKK